MKYEKRLEKLCAIDLPRVVLEFPYLFRDQAAKIKFDPEYLAKEIVEPIAEQQVTKEDLSSIIDAANQSVIDRLAAPRTVYIDLSSMAESRVDLSQMDLL